ncbi:glycerophosphoryl diester phosphodiesterase membrane domain-containing protein [Enterococcus florum]|nr:glycerophosphodiester phosphodiesterase [Enterococcus florum]
MKDLKNSFVHLFRFLKDTMAYFRDVLLLHGFMLFVLLPLLTSLIKFILRQGHISYLSYDTIGIILRDHPGVLLSLLAVLLAIMIGVFFEFTFLLISVFFIKKNEPISLSQLLTGTLIQLKKLRVSTILFFLVYFLLVLPFGGLNFNSDLLAKVKIPAFLLDYLFANRVPIIAAAAGIYLILFYFSIRLIFALPEMILRDRRFAQAVKESWRTTKGWNFLRLFGQFVLIGGSVSLLSSLGYGVVIFLQSLIETHLATYALPSAVIAMTVMQFIFLATIVLSTVGIFYITVSFMDDLGLLVILPTWFKQSADEPKPVWSLGKVALFLVITLLFGIGVGSYNTNYLSNYSLKKPLTISHRGVSEGNGVQNSLAALAKTSQLQPAFVEMDVQETKDKQFVVMHDFHLKELTGIDKRPNQLTLKELEQLNVRESDQTEPVVSFDDYLTKAEQLDQPLLIEIKATPQDSPDMVDRFIQKYKDTILRHDYILHTLDFDVAAQLKEKVPAFFVGYVMPFNIVGPPVSNVDFFTMEHTTLNRNFIDAAHDDGKEVFAWTVNDEDTMTRMMFYGVDGIVTDNLSLLNHTIQQDLTDPTYSDKLFYFITGIG